MSLSHSEENKAAPSNVDTFSVSADPQLERAQAEWAERRRFEQNRAERLLDTKKGEDQEYMNGWDKENPFPRTLGL